MAGGSIDTPPGALRHSPLPPPVASGPAQPAIRQPASGANPLGPVAQLAKPLPPALTSASHDQTHADADALARKAQVPLSGTACSLQDLRSREPHHRAFHKVLEAAVKQAEARQAGVDLAKSNYFIKLMTFAGVAVTFGVTLALTVATGGAAAPMLALTSLRLATAIGDVYYARQCVVAAQESARTGMPAKAPPMGGSCVGNWLYAYREWRNDSPKAAKDYATSRGAIFTVGLSVAMLFTGALWTPVAATQAGTISKWVASCVMGLMVPYELKVGFGHTRAQANEAMQATLMFEDACDIACGRVGVNGYSPRDEATPPEGDDDVRLTSQERQKLAALLEDALEPFKGKPPTALAELTRLRAQMAAADRPNEPAAAADAARQERVPAGIRAKAKQKAQRLEAAQARWEQARAELERAQANRRNAQSTLRAVRAQVQQPGVSEAMRVELEAAQARLRHAGEALEEAQRGLSKAREDAEADREAVRTVTRLYFGSNSMLGFVKSAAAVCAKLS